MARSIVLTRTGEPAEVLELVERDVPVPGPGEALVRLRARSVNPADLLLVRGQYGSGTVPPLAPGVEGVGIVESLGPDTLGPQAGSRVICYGRIGTWQEYLLYPARDLIPVPDALGDAEAAQAIMNPLSAWLMILSRLALGPNDWLLQTAANSTVGRAAIQIARLHGIRTINVVRSRSQVAPLEDLGADAVIVSADEDIIGRARSRTGDQGVTGAIDAVGGETASAALKALAEGGTLVVYGLLSGEPGRFDNGEMIFRRLNICGFWLRHWFLATPPEERERVVAPLLAQIGNATIRLPVEASYDLADVTRAVRHAQQPGKSGKVLLVG